MITYLVRRLLAGLLILWGVYTLTFFAVDLAPGDPFTAKEGAKTQEEDLKRLRKLWGYDDDTSMLERYVLHMRKMFVRDPEVLDREGGGLSFRVLNDGDGNRIEARPQVPARRLLLKARAASRLEDGASDVVLEAGPDGTFPEAPITKGRYDLGERFFVVGDAPLLVDTQGVTLSFEKGRVTARTTRTSPPERVVLVQDGSPDVELERAGEVFVGRGLAPGAWTYKDTQAGAPVGLTIPALPLDAGGLGFNLGVSIKHKKPVLEQLKLPLLNTLKLASLALFVQFLVGVLLGVYQAVTRGGLVDRGLTLGSLFLYSMPSFWLAVMLQLTFAVKLGWLPVAGMHSEGETGLLDLLEHMLLPIVVLGVGGAAATARYQRSAMLEVLTQDYVRTARAKGLGERAVVWRHAFRNALLPTITLLGLSLPFLVSGSVIVESIFSWPGMGREAILAIADRDVFIVTGVTLIATLMVVVGSIVSDLLYAWVDPRVRIE